MGNLAQLSEQSNARLEQLELDWLNGQIPDVASYFSKSVSEDPRAWRDLVELDMEYRWRRYQHGTSESDLDPFGFPQYPRLEHYADLLDESLRPQLLNPELLAEEYRVRSFWGDHPDRRQFLDRLPEDSGSVEIALDLMDAELEIEGMSTRFDKQSSEETTQLFDQRSGELLETLPGTDVPTRIGKYQLQELLGRGGFGEVWKAHDPDLNRPVALKFPTPNRELSEELYRSFRREAENMASLERVTGVVPVYEAGDDQGLPFIAASFIDGQDLSIQLKEHPMSYEESARIAADVAATLHRAHLKDLFHRDVKLSNILIDKEGQVFLSDFGLCVSEQEQLHEGHSAKGTYAYMAPEQIHGNSHRVDGRADIYALGVVLYRLLTGRLPFIGNTSVEYMEQTLKKAPRPPRSIDDQIPEELERICLKCVNKKVEERYATAGDLARDLRKWIAGREPVAASVTAEAAPVAQTSFVRRHPLLIALAALVAAFGALVAWKPEIVDSEGLVAGLWTNGNKPSYLPPANAEGDGIILLDATPHALLPPESDAREFAILEDLNAVEVKNKKEKYFLKSLGELTPGEDPYEIQIDLREMVPGSSGGLFYGMSEPLLRSTDTHWQSIVIERQRDGNFRLLRQFDSFQGIPKGYSHYDQNLKFGDRESKKITLRIVVSAEGLQEISVNGESYDDLARDFRTELPKRMQKDEKGYSDIDWASPEDVHGTGRFGLTCRWNTTIFANPVINGRAYKFKKTEESP